MRTFRSVNSLKTDSAITYTVIITVALIVMIVCWDLFYHYSTSECVSFVVQEKERVVNQEDSKYLVFTDNEVFENTDSIYYLKFDSSDVYRELQIGNQYNATVYGWRVPFLSMYRNIVEVGCE